MFKIKRPAIIGLLVVLLLFTTFINYQLTQQSILKASQGYQQYEVGQKESNGNEKDVFNPDQVVENNKEKENDLTDDQVGQLTDIEEVVSSRDESINEVIGGEKENYFVNFRLSRDKIRAESIDRLDDIINNEVTGEAVRVEAQQEIMNIGKITEKELQMEGLIRSKGFAEALVFLTSEDIKIVVAAEELNEQEMVKILDIVKSETSLESDNIKIMKKH